ncbi:glycine--tRNA ligase beta subunit [Brevibacillus reuszeri]|uniref:Glycine--tRNA ligase beta subunit n=1 Tax=Brevibacillus reuszeri TaxID=54915 RepID=A0A0K9Z0V1_9BACL|nr:glycine--tRNA ligase subunit beta [Brevibacillus reuszeri]KNB74095.1 glycine-tRNA synthetase subunit beta [Brevibacillus reuszeri]MED1861680.1 glycine--tRNA ligase subunit beta [Brevibacillus reuszeri]GED72807.1 glycine--tRNA ligase beta subunit [Brevibacillus reuszeri]
MSKRDLLVEVGLEEMPARFVAQTAAQFKEKVEKWLAAERIPFDQITALETPRRFAVLINGLAEKQPDRNEEAKGPARKIAQDEAGNWSKAALGFARSNHVDADQLYFKEVNGIEYVHARKSEAGKATTDLLPQLGDVITSMNFPKNMRWGARDLKYVRPIRWLVALFGEELISLEVAGVQSGRISRGHRFLGMEVEISHPGEYVSKLAEQHVLVNPEERRAIIVEQIKRMEQENGWNIPMDEGLLDEVVHLVEYPTALYGTFEEEFLTIPREVLVTSMREHQRYFPVENASGQLLNHFVTVRNGDSRALENVAKGNEKVLRARLSDARFFYVEDQKLTIESCLKRLETIVFHEELGTIGDKVRRVRKTAEQIGAKLGISQEEAKQVDRIAEISKFDLVTNMVGEFPELQGIMGEDYARKAGENELVASGVFDHYLPRFAGDKMPLSAQGAIVSMADKLDTIIGCFSIGIVPTGSQDPYGLRRMAAAIVSILVERDWQLSLEQLWDAALETYAAQGVTKRSADEVKKDLVDFFALRLKNVLQDNHVRYDVIDAVLSADLTLVPEVLAKAKALMTAVQDEEFKLIVEQFNRVNNLAQKAEADHVDEALFAEEVERALYQAYLSVSQEVNGLADQEKVLHTLSTLREPIKAFFDQVMVMAEDQAVRANRLGLLLRLSRLIFGYADFAKVVFA